MNETHDLGAVTRHLVPAREQARFRALAVCFRTETAPTEELRERQSTKKMRGADLATGENDHNIVLDQRVRDFGLMRRGKILFTFYLSFLYGLMEMRSHMDQAVDRSESIDRAAARINGLVAVASLELALAIGRAVIDELYGGDVARWHERGPKDHTLRQLAMEPKLAISASALFRALGIYELKLRAPDHPSWEVLSATHVRAVLGLPAPEQLRLLQSATEENWTTGAIERAATKVRRSHRSSRGGRPRKPRFARAIEGAEKVLASEEDAFGDLDALVEMPLDRRAELGQRLSLVRQRCEQLAALIEREQSLQA